MAAATAFAFLPAEIMLVVVADRCMHLARLDRRIDARPDAGIGEHVAAAVEIGADHLLNLEIGVDAGPRLRGGRAGEQGRAGQADQDSGAARILVEPGQSHLSNP